MKRILMILLTFILSIVGLTAFLFVVSPKPTALLINKLFEGGMAVKPANYDEIEKNTRSFQNLSYESAYQEGYLDIITPKEFEGKGRPLFFGYMEVCF